MKLPFLNRLFTRREILEYSAKTALAHPAMKFPTAMVSCGGCSALQHGNVAPF
jgi:hypothetical protein